MAGANKRREGEERGGEGRGRGGEGRGGEGRGEGEKCNREKGEGSRVFLFPTPLSLFPSFPSLLTPAMQANSIVHILLITSLSSSMPHSPRIFFF